MGSREMTDNTESTRSFFVRSIPNAITCVTAACGFVLMVSTSIPGISPEVCVLATALGLVADILDGTAARLLKVKSKFGATFDQLADLTCFGIGPGIFFTRQGLMHEGENSLSVRTFMVIVAGYSYMACSTFRIARELIVHEGTRPLYFVGIPTNLACIFVVPLAAQFPQHPLLPIIVLVLSGMMVMPAKVPKGLGLFKVTDTAVGCSCEKRAD